MKYISPKHCLFGVLLALLPLQTLNAAQSIKNKLVINNDFSLQYNEITGDGKDKSSLSDGLKYYDLLNIYSRGSIDGVKYKFNLGLKATDDLKKDTNKLSLTNLKGELSNKEHMLRVGDVYESFSQYSLNTAIKGASYRYIDKEKINQVQLIYGIAYPRWDTFWSNDTKAIKRDVYGLRYRNNLAKYSLQTGVSVVHSKDSDRVFSSDTLYENTLYTLDAQYNPIQGLVMNTDLSYSQNRRDSSELTDDESFSGVALKLRAVGNQNPSRVVMEYERVSPNFITLTGAATPDREKFKSTWRYKYSKKITTNIGFIWYRNNLNNQLAYSKNVYRPTLGITYKKIFNRKYNVIDLNYKADRIVTTNNVTNHMFDFSVSDKFGVIHNTTNLSYYKYKTGTSIVDANEIRANTKFSGRIKRDGYLLKPYLSAGTWSNRDELQTSLDKYYEAAFGLGLNIPSYKISSNFKIGENSGNRELSDDSKKVFFSANIYYKPKKLLFFNRTMIYAKVLYNDFSYESSVKNFREQGASAGMNVRF